MTDELTLSRVILDVHPHRGASREYITHQLVADLLGDRDDRGYLYRVMRESRGGTEAQVLVLSRGRPDPAPPPRPWGRVRSVEWKPFAPVIRPEAVLDYEIRINATTVVTKPSGAKCRTDVWDAVFAATATTRDRLMKSTPRTSSGSWKGSRTSSTGGSPLVGRSGSGDRATSARSRSSRRISSERSAYAIPGR